MTFPRAVTSDQHVPELGTELGLPITGTVVPYYTLGFLLYLTDLLGCSLIGPSHALCSLSHICALILHCYSWETCSSQFQSQFLWSLLKNASASFDSRTLESIARMSVSADIFSKLSNFWVTSVH